MGGHIFVTKFFLVKMSPGLTCIELLLNDLKEIKKKMTCTVLSLSTHSTVKSRFRHSTSVPRLAEKGKSHEALVDILYPS